MEKFDELETEKKKSGKDGDSADTRWAREFLATGKMDVFPEFKMLPSATKIKILCFEFFDFKQILAAKDGLFENPKKSAQLLPGVTVTTDATDFEDRGFNWNAFNECFTTLLSWATVFATDKMKMIIDFHTEVQTYGRRYELSQIVYFSNHVRRNSTGRKANWMDTALLDKAYRLTLANSRDPKPFLNNFPLKPQFSTDSRGGRNPFRGRGRGRGFGRGGRGFGRGFSRGSARGSWRGRGRGRGNTPTSDISTPVCRYFQNDEPCKFFDNGACKFAHRKE